MPRPRKITLRDRAVAATKAAGWTTIVTAVTPVFIYRSIVRHRVNPSNPSSVDWELFMRRFAEGVLPLLVETLNMRADSSWLDDEQDNDAPVH